MTDTAIWQAGASAYSMPKQELIICGWIMRASLIVKHSRVRTRIRTDACGSRPINCSRHIFKENKTNVRSGKDEI